MYGNSVQREPYSLGCCCCSTIEGARIVLFLDILWSLILAAGILLDLEKRTNKLPTILGILMHVCLIVAACVFRWGIRYGHFNPCLLLPYIIYKAVP